MIMRVIRWFKRLITVESRIPEPEHPKSDQREFDRYMISFPVIVISGLGVNGVEYHEKTVLQDISGSGALFKSRSPEKYYPGQLLKISIMLDGTSDVRARVRTEATVVRVHSSWKQMKGSDGNKPANGIAVQFDRSFEFERIDYVGTGQKDEIG